MVLKQTVTLIIDVTQMLTRRTILIVTAALAIAILAGWGWIQYCQHLEIKYWKRALAAGNHEQALRMARSLATTAAWKLRVAESAFRLRELDVARRYLREVGNVSEAKWLQVIDAGWRWEWESVDPFLEIPLDPELMIRSAALLVPVYHSAYDPIRGVEAARFWVEGEPQNPQAWAGLAAQLERLNKFEDAAEAHAARLNLEKDNVESLRAMVSFHIQRRQFMEAYPYLERLEKVEVQDPRVVVWRARYLEGMGQGPEAQALLDRLLAVAPETVDAIKERAIMLLADYQSERAALLLESIMDRQRFDPEVSTLLERAQRLANNPAGAMATRVIHNATQEDQRLLAQLSRKIVAEPRKARWRAEVAEILFRQNVPIEAIRWASSAVLMEPDNELARALLAKHSPETLAAMARGTR